MSQKLSSKINSYIFNKKYRKILIICGMKSFKGFSFKLKNKDLKIKYFYKKEKYPKLEELKKIIKNVNLFKPQLILAIGGGSTLDYAKISSALYRERNIKKKILLNKINFSLKKITTIAIPTTAGSGAESTSGAVLYINNIKYSIDNKILIPDKYFFAPEFCLKCPFEVRASSGIDAICQSIESIIAKKSNYKSLYFAKKALKILFKNYSHHVLLPNTNNAKQMCIGANFSGKAINISKTTAPHALSYPLTTKFDISHGKAVSTTMTKFLLFNFKNKSKNDAKFDLSQRFKLLFKLAGKKNINEFIIFFEKLRKIGKLKHSKDLLSKIKKNTNFILSKINPDRLSNNPVKLNAKQLRKIISSI